MTDPSGPSQGGPAVSQTDITQALRQGDMRLAAALLGRPFVIRGVVAEGRKLGRRLGFPTLNIEVGDQDRPRLGVYATRTRASDGRILPGVANFGENPTTGRVSPRLEVHLFDVDEDFYGQTVETELIDFIRPEAWLSNLDSLVAQMREDAARARTLLQGPISPNRAAPQSRRQL